MPAHYHDPSELLRVSTASAIIGHVPMIEQQRQIMIAFGPQTASRRRAKEHSGNEAGLCLQVDNQLGRIRLIAACV